VTGLRGPAPFRCGVFGDCGTSNSIGVFGNANSGFPSKGVFGRSESNGYGVYGQAISGIGVEGIIPAMNGAQQNTTPNTIAIQGNNQSTGAGGIGVQGIAQTGYGVGGYSGGVGVYGLSSGSYAIVGVTTAGSPFSGITGSADTPGAAAFAGGTSTPGCYAAYFTGPVVVDGEFTVVDPTRKHGAIKHPDGSYRLLYSMESPDSRIEDFGKGQLAGGTASIALDKDFAAIADTSDYAVFAMPLADCNGLYVTNQRASGFEVHELRGGTSNVAFRFRIVVTPKTQAKVTRLAKFELPKIKIPTVNDLPKMPAPPRAPQAPTGGVVDSQPVPAPPPSRAAPTAPTPASGAQGTVQNPVQPIPQPRSG
jgi:hypothetical protein